MLLGLQFKSLSSNQIWNPTTKLSRQSRFGYKIHLFWFKLDLFQLKDRYKDWKGRLKDKKKSIKRPKKWIQDQKGRFLSKRSIYIKKVDQIWPFSIKIDLNQTIFDLNGPNSNWIVATIKSDGWNRIRKHWLKPIGLWFQTKSGSRSITSH